MKVFRGLTDNWGLVIQFRGWDKSLTLQFMRFYVVFVAHKIWKD